MQVDSWERAINWQLLIAHSRSYHIISKLTRAAGLTPGQPKVLQYLTTHNGCTQKEIGVGCGLDKSTVAGLLTRMESAGLISRRVSPSDRRTTGVFLTEKGAEGGRIAAENSRAVDERALAGFTAAEREELSRLLSRVIANLGEQEERG